MRGNLPIPEIPLGEDVWLMVLVTSARERRTQQGRLFCDAAARNATGNISLKIWGETLESQKEIKPGLWGITGKLEIYQDRPQFVVAEYRPITLEQYREHQNADPRLPCAYTFDIETITLPSFRVRAGWTAVPVPVHLAARAGATAVAPSHWEDYLNEET